MLIAGERCAGGGAVAPVAVVPRLDLAGEGAAAHPPSNAEIAAVLASAQQVAAGVNHTCALTAAGGVKCWGHNDYGQLGDGTTTDRTTPVDVSGLASGVTAIAAGWDHTCALTSRRRGQVLGLNDAGQLGDGTTTSAPRRWT